MSKPDPIDHALDEDSLDVDTAELPQINVESLDVDFDLDIDEQGPDDRVPELTDKTGERATAWMHEMKAEVESLRDRWKEVDGNLTLSKQRITELEEVILEKDSHTQKSTTDLQTALDERTELEIRLAERDEKLNQLNAEVEEQAVANKAAVNASQDLTESFDKLKVQLDQKTQENKDLNQSVQSHFERTSALELEIANFDKTTNVVRCRVHELECYIEGRKSHWTEQNAKLAEYKESLEEMSIVVQEKDKQLTARDREKDVLSDTIRNMEKDVSQLIGRRKEQDDAFNKLQESLQDQISVTERIRSDLSARDEELGGARTQITEHIERIDSQQEEDEQKDSRIERLEEEAKEQEQRVGELTLENEKHTQELAQLEESVAERDSTIQVLQSGFEEAKATISDTKAEVTDVEAKHSQLVLENAQNQDAAEELHAKLSNVQHERDELTGELADAQKTIGSLRDELEATEDREHDLESKTILLGEEMEQLQVEVANKQEIIDAFDRGARALNDLNRDMQDTPHDHERDQDQVSDQAMIIEASQLFHNPASGTDSSETKGLDVVPVDDDVQHMIVVSDGGKGVVVHKLTKDRITIGRSGECDIPLRDTAVSRIHAHLIKCESGFEIEDAGSTNGILVNKEKVERAELHHGDIISLAGRLHLKFL